MKNPNFKAIQAFGCKKQDFEAPHEVNVKHMAMGSWHANLAKGGIRHTPTGGSPKPKKKAKPKYVRLPHELKFDKKGYVICL